MPNVQNFLSLPSATPSLLALHKRTDDPAIRFEIARIYVNCIRAVFASRPPNPNAADSGSGADGEGETPSSREATTAPATSAEALAQLTSDGVAQITADMLAQSAQYPILANESIIALALLATFGGEDAGESINDPCDYVNG